MLPALRFGKFSAAIERNSEQKKRPCLKIHRRFRKVLEHQNNTIIKNIKYTEQGGRGDLKLCQIQILDLINFRYCKTCQDFYLHCVILLYTFFLPKMNAYLSDIINDKRGKYTTTVSYQIHSLPCPCNHGLLCNDSISCKYCINALSDPPCSSNKAQGYSSILTTELFNQILLSPGIIPTSPGPSST